jgi:hypothetical protein
MGLILVTTLYVFVSDEETTEARRNRYHDELESATPS